MKEQAIVDNKPVEVAPPEQVTNEGVDRIVDRIIKSATNTAKVIVDNANQNVESNVASESSKIANYCDKMISDAEDAAKNLLKFRLMLAEMDSKKALLKQRQDIVERVYFDAAKAIADSKKYPKLLEDMITKYAEDGDLLIAAKGDKLITAEYVKKLGDKIGKKLVLSKERGEFLSGVILRTPTYDKNLIIADIIKELKKETEAEIYKEMFGDTL